MHDHRPIDEHQHGPEHGHGLSEDLPLLRASPTAAAR